MKDLSSVVKIYVLREKTQVSYFFVPILPSKLKRSMSRSQWLHPGPQSMGMLGVIPSSKQLANFSKFSEIQYIYYLRFIDGIESIVFTGFAIVTQLYVVKFSRI